MANDKKKLIVNSDHIMVIFILIPYDAQSQMIINYEFMEYWNAFIALACN